MTKVVGDIAVSVGADISGLQDGMRRAGRSVKDFDNSFAAAAKNVGRVSLQMGAAAGVAAVGVAALARNAAGAAAEIEKMSNLAGTTPEQFQRMAQASRTVGISQEKLADILKDVNDRFGDFAATGAGPLKDFFDNVAPKVGVTAEHFKNLTSPEALQLFVDTLERAGTPQQEMVFYLEAMASDLTALAPLLADNGAKMRELGDRAAEAGQILSNDAVKGSAALAAEMDRLGESISTQANQALLDNKEAIGEIVAFINGMLIPAMSKLIGLLGTVAEGFNKWGDAWDAVRNRFGVGFTPAENLPAPGLGASGVRSGAMSDLLGGHTLPGAVSGGSSAVDLDGLLTGGSGSGDVAGGEGGDTLGAGTNEGLQEFLAQRVAIIENFNARELDLTRQRVEAVAAVEQASAQSRLSEFGGMFGDLASLMQTENDKLFKVGKAAALAKAIVDGHQSAVAAWKHGMNIGGPPVAAAFTAASLARTGAMISQIASASPRGTSAGGGAGGGAAAAAPAAAPLQVMLSGIGQNDFIRGSQLGELLDRLQDEAGDRGYRLMVAQ